MRFAPGVHGPPHPVYSQLFGGHINRLLAVAYRVDQLLGGRLVVTSWHRTRCENERIRSPKYPSGGAPTSQHLLGTAIDLNGAAAGYTQKRLSQVVAAVANQFGMTAPLTSEGESVHLQSLPPGVSAQVLSLAPALKWGPSCAGIAPAAYTPGRQGPQAAYARDLFDWIFSGEPAARAERRPLAMQV